MWSTGMQKLEQGGILGSTIYKLCFHGQVTWILKDSTFSFIKWGYSINISKDVMKTI